MTSSPTSTLSLPAVRASTRTGLPDIALIGKAGAGKSTAAEWFEELAGYQRMSFAAALKDIVAHLWGDEARTDRHKLQELGVAVRRIEPDTWVNLVLDAIPSTDSPVVIDDCRFPNEYWALKSAGFAFIRVKAKPEMRLDRLHVMGKETTPEQLEHESETSLDDFDASYTVTNEGDRITYLNDLSNVLKKVVQR